MLPNGWILATTGRTATLTKKDMSVSFTYSFLEYAITVNYTGQNISSTHQNFSCDLWVRMIQHSDPHKIFYNAAMVA